MPKLIGLTELKKKLKGRTVADMSEKRLQMLALKWQMVEQNSKKLNEYARKVKQLYKKNEELVKNWNEISEKGKSDSESLKVKREAQAVMAQEEVWVTKIIMLNHENGERIREYVEAITGEQ